ncbi:MAG TPA: hypothetical protein VFB76_06060 [Candidatus Angelobacter sp.]|nr:hypothetical protein [Candidatus Angelobacter sp.]
MVDAKTDLVTTTIAVNSPGKMVSAGGSTVIQSTLSNSVVIFDNATATIRFTVPLAALPVDVAITPDGKTGWVAENNGTVESIDTASGAITGTTAVAGVQRLVIGPQGNTVLAFNDTLAITFTVITPTGFFPIGNAGLDHPTNAVFAGDDNHFIVLDCGPECGGITAGSARVVLVPPGFGGPGVAAPIPVSGATIGLLNGSNTLFVAGSPTVGLNAGTVQVLNPASTTANAAVSIADGRHNLMALTSNGRLFIGSTGCTAGPVNAQNQRQGCLTIFDTTTQTATPVLVPANRATLDVTGLAPVPGRNVIYVVQGGVLDILDITTNAVSTTATPPNITGTAFSVVQLSP